MESSTAARIIRLVLIIIIIVGIIWFIIWLFSPRDRSNTTEDVTSTSALYEQVGTVRYVQEGAILAPEDYYKIVITISSQGRDIDIYHGYDDGPERSESFPNSIASYDKFYAALEGSGFFTIKVDKKNADRQGYCPLGIRYDYQAGDDITDPDSDTWGASCSSKAGTFGGNRTQVKKLFINQIPNYKDITKGVDLT